MKKSLVFGILALLVMMVVFAGCSKKTGGAYTFANGYLRVDSTAPVAGDFVTSSGKNIIIGDYGTGAGINFNNIAPGQQFVFATAGVPRLNVDSNGNVGIGTAPTGGRLEITSGGNPSPNIQINSAEGRGIKIDKTGGGETLLYLTQNDVYNNQFLEAYGGGETPLLARIDGKGGAYFAGNVGIGTTAPNSKLEVKGDSSGNHIFSAVTNSGSSGLTVYSNGNLYTGAKEMQFGAYGARLRMYSSNKTEWCCGPSNTGAWTCSKSEGEC
ncbi:hypothetical protein HYU07_00410 [Candidatus Woesearchaeota archaeon]|nr:hypothetical protein [Candidatus Woesearchaeota archaeon]